jgi:hypothetical protein
MKKRAARSSGGLPASFAQSAEFEPRHLNVKSGLPGYFLFQLFERRTRVLQDRSALEAGQMAVVATGFGLVIMLLPFQVHQVQFVNQSLPFQQADGSVHGGTVDFRVLFPSKLEQLGGIQVTRGVLDEVDKQSSLGGDAYASPDELINQRGSCNRSSRCRPPQLRLGRNISVPWHLTTAFLLATSVATNSQLED